VVIATYPGGDKFLAETVQSFRDQGVDPKVVCDTRPTEEKWNEAIATCETPYLALAHHDDQYLPGFCEKTVAYLDAHPGCAAVFTLDYWIDETGNRIGQTDLCIPQKDEYTFEDVFRAHLKTGNLLRCETVVLRTEFARQVPYPDKSVCDSAHDWQYWFLLLDRWNVGIIPEKLVLYRHHPGSDTQKNVVGGNQWHGVKALEFAANLRPETALWRERVNLGRAVRQYDDTKEIKRLQNRVENGGNARFLVCHEPPDNAGTGVLVADRCRKANRDCTEKVTYYIYPTQEPKITQGFQRGCPVITCHPSAFGQLMDKFEPEEVEFHHLMRWPVDILSFAPKGPLFLHDAYLWCPKWHSFNEKGNICNTPGPILCGRCVGKEAFEETAFRNRTVRGLVKSRKVSANSLYLAVAATPNLGCPVGVHHWEVPPLHIPVRGPRLGFFGGFYDVKGIGPLLDAMRELPDVQLLLFSDIPEEMRDGRRLFGFDNVVCMGGYRRTDMPALVNLIDLAVVPSLCESWGLVKRELDMLGVPVIATQAGGLDGTIEPNDPKALVEAIRGR